MSAMDWFLVAFWEVFDNARADFFYGQIQMGKIEYAAFDAARQWKNETCDFKALTIEGIKRAGRLGEMPNRPGLRNPFRNEKA